METETLRKAHGNHDYDREENTMKTVLLSLAIISLFLLAGCGTSDVPRISDPSKPLSEMTNAELRQIADRYGQIMYSDQRVTGATAAGIQVIVYQNELILRELQKTGS